VALRDKFAPICPDFVVEVLSPSDTVAETRRKVEEYIANGAKLAWMIDRKNRRVHVFRPGEDEQTIETPSRMTGDPGTSRSHRRHEPHLLSRPGF
jgi:Uma2 family endonuclease